MKVFSIEDVIPQHVFLQVRERLLSETGLIRRNRRVEIGPFATIHFENRETLKFELNEVLLLKKLFSADDIGREIAAFNQLIPGDLEITATLNLNFTDEHDISENLEKQIDNEISVFLKIGDTSLRGSNLVTHTARDSARSFRHLRFRLTQELAKKLLASEIHISLKVGSSHFDGKLNQSQKMAVTFDLFGDS